MDANAWLTQVKHTRAGFQENQMRRLMEHTLSARWDALLFLIRQVVVFQGTFVCTAEVAQLL